MPDLDWKVASAETEIAARVMVQSAKDRFFEVNGFEPEYVFVSFRLFCHVRGGNEKDVVCDFENATATVGDEFISTYQKVCAEYIFKTYGVVLDKRVPMPYHFFGSMLICISNLPAEVSCVAVTARKS